ncbi:ubiquitin thiolesterase [Histoplasma capsulatum var. duboisii H88]|uniref:ubiquitinyl hydrolase 1 n=1 Tax=Ajellomyces capsulatus (strain H88) TaxID=544711 RepID=F0UQ65_AJEC8|nr:ubiquitin thiolesterase [Histoplasma capsulatum var. duboisii H88]QSS54057.1 ubiquitin thiolesterase [Histoplasma capsulatum var. duboisii H88]
MSNIPSSGNMADPDHMLEFQKLSNHYEPDLQGPLVGPKQSSSMITSEYANADPIYVAKTTALSHTHSHYRIMKGDGNCGWRAVAFGYFETLFNLRDTTKVTQELARLKSFNKLLNSAGCQEHLYEMFVDATEELLNQISQEIGKGSFDDTFLFNAFNDEYNSSSLIMHFRLMTSAWMKLNSSRYTDFLGVSVGEYCEKTIETVKTEIDEVGLQGLFDGVIEGSGLAIEILYLDRSEGTEVTPHLLSPNSPIATIRLLYRPGHYDLLYQTDQTRHDQGLTSVNFQYAMSSDYLPWYSSALPFDLNPVLMSIPSLPLNTSSISPQAPYSQPYTFSGRHIDPNIPPPVVSQSPPAPSQPSSISSFPVSPVSTPDKSTELQIRMNPLVCEPMNTLPLPSIPLSNSSTNLAHFHHPDFQPSQWDPNEEYK